MSTKSSKSRRRPRRASGQWPSLKFTVQVMTAQMACTTGIPGQPPSGAVPAAKAKLARPYVETVFQDLSRVLGALRRADQALYFIGIFPRQTICRRREISRKDWIVYHYLVYCVMIVALYDCALLLVNAVFSLGLQPRACRDNTVTANSRLAGTQVAARLKTLHKVIGGFRGIRREMVHRASDPDLGQVLELCLGAEWIEDTMADMNLASTEQQIPSLLSRPIRDDILRLKRRELVDTLRADLDQVEAAVGQLFDAVSPRFVDEVLRYGLPKEILKGA